ncbi:MAG: hypothetical protein ABEJ80_07355 [Halarchaeum sp.]
MSNQPLHETPMRRLASHADGLSALRRPVEALGFWSAVVLPFLYVPLVLSGLESANTWIAFVALVLLHVVSLVVGRGYHD